MATQSELFGDLAVVVLAAGLAALLFHRLKQPVILGYLAAGFIVGPFSWGRSFISDGGVLTFLGEIGIVFLLFALGLEFSLGKLRRVGARAMIAGTVEIALMLALGYAIGQAFGWSQIQSIFLAAVMSISSTTIIVKVLAERGDKDKEWAQLTLGILIIEDVLAILILTALSSAAASGNFQPELLTGLLGKLGIFIGASLLLGLLAAPRLVDKLVALKMDEVMVVLATGVAFGMALLAGWLGFSPGLGAFIAGALMAESPRVVAIEHKIAPMRDVFTAIFFVTVGAALDPAALAANWPLILVLAATVVVGKLVGVGIGTFVAGVAPATSVRVGLALGQIGEFGFVIAALGVSLAVVPPSLYTIAIAVSAITAFLTPHAIRRADGLVGLIGRRVPFGFHAYATTYGAWVGRMGRSDREDPEWQGVRMGALMMLLSSAVLFAVFAGGNAIMDGSIGRFWGTIGMVLAATPFVVVFYQGARRLVNALARLAVPQRLRDCACTPTERLLRRTFGLGATLVTAALCVLLGGLIVQDTRYLLGGAIVGVAVSSGFLGRSLGGFSREVERTLERLATGSADRADAEQALGAAQAWGASSRSVVLPEVSGGGGRTIGALRLRELTGASVVSVRRQGPDGFSILSPGPDHRFEAGDDIVIMGEAEALTRAEEILLGRDLGVTGGATEVLVREGSVLAGARAVGATVGHDVQLLVVRRAGATLAVADELVLEAGDVLVVAGPDAEVERFGRA